jgi:quercetin dioxygenase-like cupin family protein
MLNTDIQTAEAVTEPYVTNLDEMIGIQAHSIVSKVITHKEAGTVTMFAFDEGQGISEQTLPFDAVLFVTSGEMEVIMNGGESRRVKEEMMIHIPAGTPHTVNAIRPFKMFSILIRAHEAA